MHTNRRSNVSRERKNGKPAVTTTQPRVDEVALEQAYLNLSSALKLWRRHPETAESRQLLMDAIDARDDALNKVVDEDERLEEQQAAHVPG